MIRYLKTKNSRKGRLECPHCETIFSERDYDQEAHSKSLGYFVVEYDEGKCPFCQADLTNEPVKDVYQNATEAQNKVYLVKDVSEVAKIDIEAYRTDKQNCLSHGFTINLQINWDELVKKLINL